jgi:hypothetical protein
MHNDTEDDFKKIPTVDGQVLAVNLVDMAGTQGLNLPFIVQPCSMESEILCAKSFKTLLSPTTTVKSMINTCWTSVCIF